MLWISSLGLGGLALGLLLAPAFEIRLTGRVVNPLLVAALLLAIALVLANAGTYATDRETLQALGIVSGILAAFGLFFVVVGCARFATLEKSTE